MKIVTPNVQASDTILKSKMLDQLKSCIRDNYHILRTGETYVQWALWLIRFHGLSHLAEMGAPEVKAFLSYLKNERHVAVATHEQTLCVSLFLYKHFLRIELPWLDEISRPILLPLRPTVLIPNEVASVFEHMRNI